MHKFSNEFFHNNRRRLSEVLPQSLIVIAGHVSLQYSGDTAYPFRQDSSFWYLCGVDEPDILLVIDTSKGKSTLLFPEKNEYQKEWDGTFDYSAYKKESGVELVTSRSELGSILQDAKKRKLQVCYLAPLPEVVDPYGFYSNPARRILEAEIKLVIAEPKDVRLDIARLRQIKQPEEILAIQTAIHITAETLKTVWNNISDLKTEKDVERTISVGFFSNDGDGHAFEPIIASGKNAAIIHYRNNVDKIKQNTFLLMDVGAQYNGYASDISRTWFIGKKPNDRHLALHEIVLQTQSYAYSLLKPGVLLREYQLSVEEYSKKLLQNVGIKLDHFPHGISHFLGLDVHDSSVYNEPLVENTVLTVEPGLYLPDEAIGIRIEDDVRITKTGIEIMSKQIPSRLLY